MPPAAAAHEGRPDGLQDGVLDVNDTQDTAPGGENSPALSRTQQNGLWNAASNGLNALAGMLASVLVVRNLSTHEYGVLSYYLWLASVTGAIGTLALPHALTKVSAELLGQGRERETEGLSALVWWLTFAFNIFITAALLAAWWLKPGDLYLPVVALVQVPVALASIVSSVLWSRQEYRPVATWTSLAAMLQVGLVLASLRLGWGGPGFAVAVLGSSTLTWLGLTLRLRREQREAQAARGPEAKGGEAESVQPPVQPSQPRGSARALARRLKTDLRTGPVSVAHRPPADPAQTVVLGATAHAVALAGEGASGSSSRSAPTLPNVAGSNIAAARSALARVSRPVWRQYLAFLLPATLIRLIEVVVWQRSELFFLSRMSSTEQIGYYSLAYTLYSIVLAVGWALINGYYPAISHLQGAGETRGIQKQVQQGANLAVMYAAPVGFAAIVALGLAVRLLYGEKMLPAVPVGQVLLAGLIPGVVCGMLTLTLSALGRVWYSVWLGVGVSTVNILLALWLIPRQGELGGALGAALASTGSQVAYFFMLVAALASACQIRLNWWGAAGMAALAALVLLGLPLLLRQLLPVPELLSVALGLALGAALYAGAVWRSGLWRSDQGQAGTQGGGSL